MEVCLTPRPSWGELAQPQRRRAAEGANDGGGGDGGGGGSGGRSGSRDEDGSGSSRGKFGAGRGGSDTCGGTGGGRPATATDAAGVTAEAEFMLEDELAPLPRDVVFTQPTTQNVAALYKAYSETRSLVCELSMRLPSDRPFFTSLGDSPRVPAFLRYPHGALLDNWRLPKRDIDAAAREFWSFFYTTRREEAEAVAEKVRKTQSAGHAQAEGAAAALAEREHKAIDEIFDAFLLQYGPAQDNAPPPERFHTVREYAYNVFDGLKRFRHETELDLLLEVLSGNLPEELHAAQMKAVETLRKAFAEADAKEHSGAAEGTLKRKGVPAVLRKVFPTKSDAQLNALLQALDRDQLCLSPEALVRYADLFKEDRDGNTSTFIQRVREQGLLEPRDFVIQCELELWSSCAGSPVSAEQAMAAISVVDPKKPKTEVGALVAAGFGHEAQSSLALEETVALRTFCKRLLRKAPMRTGRPAKDNGTKSGRRKRISKLSVVPSQAPLSPATCKGERETPSTPSWEPSFQHDGARGESGAGAASRAPSMSSCSLSFDAPRSASTRLGGNVTTARIPKLA